MGGLVDVLLAGLHLHPCDHHAKSQMNQQIRLKRVIWIMDGKHGEQSKIEAKVECR